MWNRVHLPSLAGISSPAFFGSVVIPQTACLLPAPAQQEHLPADRSSFPFHAKPGIILSRERPAVTNAVYVWTASCCHQIAPTAAFSLVLRLVRVMDDASSSYQARESSCLVLLRLLSLWMAMRTVEVESRHSPQWLD